MLTVDQYECSVCDSIGRAVKCDQHAAPVTTDTTHDHLRCASCDERIVYLSPDLNDDFGFDDDAGELD